MFVHREIGPELNSGSDDVPFLPQVFVNLVGGAEASIGFPSSLQQDTLSNRFLGTSVDDADDPEPRASSWPY